MLALATIAHGRPKLIEEQIRLIERNLLDEYKLHVLDTSRSDDIRAVCIDWETAYHRCKGTMHHEGLNEAAQILLETEAPYIGFLDHDIFPVQPTTLIDKIEEAGFYGVGQRHPATGNLYLWPGFWFCSHEWLNGRPLDFTGYRDGDKRNDGDTGSGLWPLFADEDWEKMFRVEHSHRPIREPDGYGLQSWGYEMIGSWLHFTNGSHWMTVPDAQERDRLLFDLLAEC